MPVEMTAAAGAVSLVHAVAETANPDPLYLGELRTPAGSLTLQSVVIEADVRGLTVDARIRQTFFNPFATPLETTYVFGLPDRLAARAFTMEVAGRVIIGKVLERAEAREAYDDAINAGTRAAIVEEERPGTFTLRVGRIAPGETAIVEVVLCGPAVVENGEATVRFPLTVAPRYVTGTPLDDPTGSGTQSDTDVVPDASRISPPRLDPGEPSHVQVEATVRVHGLGRLTGTPHATMPTTLQNADGVWTLTLAAGQEPNADFAVRTPIVCDSVHSFGFVHDDIAAVWVVPPLTETPTETPTGTATGTPTGKPASDSAAVRPKDVVVLLDRSGSMDGWKMVAARRAAARLVDALGPNDRVSVAAFDSVLEWAPTPRSDRLAAATDRYRFAIATWLGNVAARGGTELTNALVWALRNFTGPETPERTVNTAAARDKVLIVVTDAQVGDEDNALRQAGASLDGVRVLGVAIDAAPSTAFLRRLAGRNGRIDVVESEDRLDEVLARLCRDVVSPAVIDVSLVDESGRPFADATGFGDVFLRSPLLLCARVHPGQHSVKVRGRLPDGSLWSQEVALVQGGPSVRFGWARARLRDLEDAYAAGGGSVDPDTIVRLSVEEQVLCRFTALLAVDQADETVNGRMRRVDQPVASPAGWEMFAAAPASAPPSSGASGWLPGVAAKMAARTETSRSAFDYAPADDDRTLLEAVLDALKQRVTTSFATLSQKCADRAMSGGPKSAWQALADAIVRLAADPTSDRLANSARDLVTQLYRELNLGKPPKETRRRSPFWR